MIVYQAKIRLAGNVANEVIKSPLTASEIRVLQVIHGLDAVADIQRIGQVNRSDAAERKRLAGTYRHGKGIVDNGEKLINEIFGVGGALPQEYVEPEIEEVDDEIEVDMTDDEIVLDSEPEIKRTVVSKPVETVTLEKIDADALAG
jgi:hypothetical protein